MLEELYAPEDAENSDLEENAGDGSVDRMEIPETEAAEGEVE